MRRRDLMAGGAGMAGHAPAARKERRNVLLVYCEQFQHSVASFAGGPALTPALEKFAAGAAMFRTACTTTALCSPNRAGLFTGRLGHRTGLDDNCNVWHSRLTGLDLRQTTLIEWARRAGYFTGYYGKWHLGKDGPIRRGAQRYPESGFDRTKNPPGKVVGKPDFTANRRYYAKDAAFDEKPGFYVTDQGAFEQSETGRLARSGAAFLKEAEESKQPFFLTVGFNAVHPPYHVVAPYNTMYDWKAVELPGNLRDTFHNKPAYQNDVMWPFHDTGHLSDTDWRRLIAYYRGFVSQLDRAIGGLLDAVEQNGLSQNTMVVVVADHGDMTGAHNRFDKGPYAYEEVMRIPLVVRMPGAPPRVVERHVSSIDLNRTLTDWMGLEPDTPNIDSRSLIPLIERGDAGWDSPDEAFYRYEWYNGLWFGVRAIRTHAHKYSFNPCGVDELYDLRKDPAEMHNLAGAPAMREVERRLAGRLLAHLEETEDRMLAGKLREYLGSERA